jgi:hypothetical protein
LPQRKKKIQTEIETHSNHPLLINDMAANIPEMLKGLHLERSLSGVRTKRYVELIAKNLSSIRIEETSTEHLLGGQYL